jgi:hypothetical protein
MSKKLLGSLSPAYGMLSGEGAFGKLADSGLGGVIPNALAQQRRRKRKDGTEMTPEEEAAMAEAGMKKGGKVESSYKKGGSVSSASKRADGIAQRGKTRGKVY